ncbi:MAG: hypothetical protein COU46_02155 [Candidatus Niyogibacteria bacterium CG10_big_fil_rev_8_21_14_0_10_42_19]|uniref:Dipeptidylpeptidase IV N-terminal domain-containing protein n=1 Tax=Candidatus Niyogibacteria bacterium CG10_big_fil_rev_8_21_14_0_10_42_19 TaxID=1974725 RepID=A0A2H0TFK1_9BACT|nr:MAG: hypothetical protein COU46_02155 [Candidatus Niyogibacteria bacterium CG10_big_fil_rev_8_21_14_0_10_42_19]
MLDGIFPSAGRRDNSQPDGDKEKDEGIKIDQRLVQITQTAVSGFALKNEGLRFIERSTGHVFESDSIGANKTRISNTTIPQIFKTAWDSDAEGALIMYREEENIRLASVLFKGTSSEGVLLPADIISFDYAPDRDRIIYLVKTSAGLTTFAANPDNTKQAEILRLPPADFMIGWPAANSISFLSRPSGEAEGVLYRFDINKNSFDKVLGPALGLGAKWSSNGAGVMYSIYDRSIKKPRMFVYNLKEGKTIDLNVQTFAQKCSWPGGEDVFCAIPTSITAGIYPDLWLTGEESFNDHLWKINISTLQKKDLADLQDIDVNEIKNSGDGKFIYFQNKKDGSLWGFRFEE